MNCWRLVGLGGVRTRPGWISFALVALACGKAEPPSGEAVHSAGAPGAAGGSDAVAAAGASTTGGLAGAGGAVAVTASGGDQASTGGAGVAEGGQAGGSAGVATGGMGNVWQGAVAPGTCGVARRISLPTINEFPLLRREAGGFLAGPWSGARNADDSLPIDWLVIDASGEKQTPFRVTAPALIGGNDILHFGAPDQAFVFSAITLGTGPADFLGAVLKDGVTAVPAYVTLFKLSTFTKRFGFMRAAAALDGQRAVFAAGSGPAFSIVVIAGDGSVAGTARTLTAANDIPGCRALQPTDHAGALSVIEYDSEGEAFHRLELTADGDVAWDVKVPLHRARPPNWNSSSLPCPLQALTPDGIALLTFESVADREAWHLYRISRDGSTSDEPWETLSELPRGFAIQGSDAFALTVRNDAPPMVVKRSNGQDQQFPIDAHLSILGSDGPFASEAGSLFIDARPLGDWRQILEVKCP